MADAIEPTCRSLGSDTTGVIISLPATAAFVRAIPPTG